MSDDPGFALLGEDIVHEGYAMSVVVARFGAPDGREFTRDVIRHVGAVAVLPLHDDGTVTLVRQYRAPIGQELLEIPAGLRDVADEDLELTATRELAEEAGLAAEAIEHLCSFHNAAGLSDEVVHVYRATGLSEVDRDAQGPEEQHMQVERHPLADLVAMVRQGEITDAKTVVGVLLTALP
ncbi:MAG: NUDIX hydrolase [Acidimicrobiales bacterium]|nr:NUDIX hydrolase [Acidimicrobiales bacterium]